ncbi:golgi uridine diphosphate-N- acetylglucosamine transporter [Pichia californica]|uniref:Golgi uridine diphosphate-N- acetylglucosamine transporter n=1 Tax=Pichia californica TaxID=460514 RepID=A0A9P6WNC4_9ASCO|nr:golgi uridine diphosphate-N- acetylglucosamine transporter [[Candida] californica]KAG0690309.1 golgi uridine diphosphate-N- acetylglucosamine transporter [[Candida] californica]
MPTHIIFRSSGTAMTILLGYLLWNKRYNKEKIFGSALIAIGTILFTLDAKGEMVYEENENDNYQDNLTGISLLLLATIINSMTSLYKEQIYQGKKNDTKKIEWREVLYYNYFYGIIMYIPLLGKVNNELQRLKTLDGIIIFTFLMNWITQLTCILGVNILTFKISALSLTIVLLVRRFLSLIISIYIFNNSIHFNGFLGIIAVFTGAIVYSFGSLTNKFEKTNKLKD